MIVQIEHFNATWSTLIGLGLAVHSSNHDQVLFHYLEFKYKSYYKCSKYMIHYKVFLKMPQTSHHYTP